MLISNGGKIVICTPTKTGSTSLEKDLIDIHKLARRMYKGEAMGIKGTKDVGYRHGSVCDKKVEKRFLLVRHPLDRFVSSYYYLQKQSRARFYGVHKLITHAMDNNPNAYCKEFLKSGDTMWTRSLEQYADEFKPTHIFKLEDGLSKIYLHFGILALDVSYVNKSNSKGWIDFSKALDKSVKAAIIKYHKPSITRFGYALK